MSKIRYILFSIVLLAAVSCGGEKLPSSMLWGEVDYYNDFLFKKYEPMRMTKTICYEFNEDSKGRVNDVKFALYSKGEDGEYVAVEDDVILYKNGEVSADNTFTISPNDSGKELELGIEFTPQAKEGVHKWYLKVLENGGLNRINEYSLEEQMLPILLEWQAEKSNVTNPLLLLLLILLACLVGALVVWIILLKPQLYPGFKVRTLCIESQGAIISKRVRGYKRVVCTSRRQSQSIFSVIGVGKTLFIKGDFWSMGDVVITPKDKKSVRVKLTNEYVAPSNVIIKDDVNTYVVSYTSDSSQSATLSVQ